MASTSGLIPLLLPSGGRRSTIDAPSATPKITRMSTQYTPQYASSTGPAHRRQYSLPVARSYARRGSVGSQAGGNKLPSSPAEWRQAVDEVKRRYYERRYRACWTRCRELISALPPCQLDDLDIEPLYVINLHFYAASAMEMGAVPLSLSSTLRTKLLADARGHYDKAAVLIEKAEERAIRTSRASSSTESLDSPGLTSSRASAASGSSPSTPRSSIGSLDGISPNSDARQYSTAPAKATKKKISFSGLPDVLEIPSLEQPCEPREPYVRPDSPTLGWEDDLKVRRCDQFGSPIVLRKPSLPPVITKPQPQVVPVSERPEQLQQPLSATFSDSSIPPTPNSATSDSHLDMETFLASNTANRLCVQLSALRSQVRWHREAVDALLTAAEDDENPPVPSFPAPPRGVSGLRLRTNGLSSSVSSASDLSSADEGTTPASDTDMYGPPSPASSTSTAREDFYRSPAGVTTDATVSSSPSREEQRPGMAYNFSRPGTAQSFSRPGTSMSYSRPGTAMSSSRPGSAMGGVGSGSRPGTAMSGRSRSDSTDAALQERIERLRASGWQRKRFDSRRYEALRESVLGELS